jgi:hypothetical protein
VGSVLDEPAGRPAPNIEMTPQAVATVNTTGAPPGRGVTRPPTVPRPPPKTEIRALIERVLGIRGGNSVTMGSMSGELSILPCVNASYHASKLV